MVTICTIIYFRIIKSLFLDILFVDINLSINQQEKVS